MRKTDVLLTRLRIGHSVEKHSTLNTCRCVIPELDFLYSTKEEILENLNVIGARRITIGRNGQVLPTKHMMLTLNCPNVPKRIWYQSCLS